MPQCPLCKGTTEWQVYLKSGWLGTSYMIVCGLCDAEWEYLSKAKDWTSMLGLLLFGPLLFAAFRRVNIATDDRMWTLRKSGKVAKAEQYVGKKIQVSDWKTIPGV